MSPILNERIDWYWFIPSQIAFGLVCGFVVNLQTKVRTPQFQALPFAVRAGLHASEQVDEQNSLEGLKMTERLRAVSVLAATLLRDQSAEYSSRTRKK